MTGAGANGADILRLGANGAAVPGVSANGVEVPEADVPEIGGPGSDVPGIDVSRIRFTDIEEPDHQARYVIHLPVIVNDLIAATHLAVTLGRSLRWLPHFDVGETTVTEEGDQRVHHRVFCDRLLGGGRRCPLRAGHGSPCTPPAGTAH